MNRRHFFVILFASVLTLTLTACNGGGDPDGTTTGNITLPDWAGSYVSAPTSSSPAESKEEDSSVFSSPSSNPETTSSQEVNTSNYTHFTENSANAPDLKNITLKTINGVVSISDREMIIEIQNRTGWEVFFSTKYILKRASSDGQLIDVPFVDSPDFGNTVYLLSNGWDSFATIDLTLLKDGLETGTYLVGLNMMCNGYPGDFYLYTSFAVK